MPVYLLLGVLGLVGAALVWLSLADEPADKSADTTPLASRAEVTLGAPAPPPSLRSTPQSQFQILPSVPPAPPSAVSEAPKPEPSETIATPTPSPPVAVARVAPPPVRAASDPPDTVVASVPAPQLKLAPVRTGPALGPAPDPALHRDSAQGPLPVIAPDGRVAWRSYARPFNTSDARPRLGIVVSGLGLSSAATDAAIQGLPGGVTLAFSPYADNLANWIRLARAAGHEVLLTLPMEPTNYPNVDPGPQTLLTTLPPRDNLERLEWTLSRATGYVGVVDFMGSRFTASAKDLRPVLRALRERGLLFLDSRAAVQSAVPEIADEIGLPWAASLRVIDEVLSRALIDARLAELEARARSSGTAIGLGSPYPVTLERIAAWTAELERKGFALAPISAFVPAPAAARQ